MKEPQQAEACFMAIADRFCIENDDVHLGKMMSSPSLKYKDKVFAFYFKESMGFRLGADFDKKKVNLKKMKPLSPFKTKPPLKGWFVVDRGDMEKWDKLATMALEFTRTLSK